MNIMKTIVIGLVAIIALGVIVASLFGAPEQASQRYTNAEVNEQSAIASPAVTITPAPAKAELEANFSTDTSNPYMLKVFVKLTNVGVVPAKNIRIKVEFQNTNKEVVGIEKLESWQTAGTVIQPGTSETFELTSFSEQVVKQTANFNLKWEWD